LGYFSSHRNTVEKPEMTKLTTVLITSLLTLAGTSAYAAEGTQAPAPEKMSATSYETALPVKAPVLLAERAPSQRVVRIVKEPVAVPVVRKANMSADTKFVFTSPKNTNTKTYMPTAAKTAAMPNLFTK